MQKVNTIFPKTHYACSTVTCKGKAKSELCLKKRGWLETFHQHFPAGLPALNVFSYSGQFSEKLKNGLK